MAKLIDRDPTQEMIDAGREALNLAKRISADEIPLVFSYMYDAAPEIRKNPVAWMIDDDGDVEYNGVDRFSCGRTGGVPLYTFPPDAQAEIAKRDARIETLEIRLSGFSDLTGLMQSSLEGDTSRISELLDQNEKQADEIERLKGVIAKCACSLHAITKRANYLDVLDIAREANEALAAIKEIDHATD